MNLAFLSPTDFRCFAERLIYFFLAARFLFAAGFFFFLPFVSDALAFVSCDSNFLILLFVAETSLLALANVFFARRNLN